MPETDIGRNVAEIRRRRRWSQEELVFQSWIHRTYMSGIERGARNPTVMVLERLAKALKVPPGENPQAASD